MIELGAAFSESQVKVWFHFPYEVRNSKLISKIYFKKYPWITDTNYFRYVTRITDIILLCLINNIWKNWHPFSPLAECEATLAGATERQNAATLRVKDLEDKIKNAKSYRERELKTAEQELAKAKTKADKANKAMKEKEQVGL